MLIKNTNPEFGHAGPFRVDSIDQLLKEMGPCFKVWAEDSYNDHENLSDIEGFMPTPKEDFIKEEIERLKNNFVKGLRIIEI